MTTELLLTAFQNMLRIRECEELICREYAGNLMKTPVHLAVGAEAIPCGVLAHFPLPRVFGTYRNHHWYLETTKDVRSFFLELLGKQSAPCQGRAGSMHLCDPTKGMILSSAVVSTTLPVALGDAWAGQRDRASAQTIVYFGDGAVEEGVFFETLNFAALKKIPLLFICEDNGLAIHAHRRDRQSFAIESLVSSCGVPYLFSEAFSVEDVSAAAQKAAQLLERGPVFLHLEYFRTLEHVGIAEDFSYSYREEPQDLRTGKDPLWNCRELLKKQGLSETQLHKTEQSIRAEVIQTYQRCLEEPDADPTFVDRYLFAEGHHA